jgi:hypothetical protein
MQEMLHEKDELESQFNERLYGRWKIFLDLFETIIVMSREIGEEVCKKYKESASENNDFLFEASIFLQARGCLISEQILSLSKNGFPDGALSCWRTLHEIAVYSCCINKYGQEIAERFLRYFEIEKLKEMKMHQKNRNFLGYNSVVSEDITMQQLVVRRLLERFGEEFNNENGWIKSVLANTKFNNIEKDVELDYFRLYYKKACCVLHARHQDEFAPLGTSECAEKILLVGRSNSAIDVPMMLSVMSLMIVTSNLLTIKCDIDLAVELKTLEKFKNYFLQQLGTK